MTKFYFTKFFTAFCRPSTLAAVAILFTVCSCSDDETVYGGNAGKNSSDNIEFNVNLSTNWNSGNALTTTTTRSATTTSSRLDVLTLSSAGTEANGSDSKKLYLVPEVSDGIKLSSQCKGSSTNTRSSLTDNSNIDSFGVFASLRPDGSENDNSAFSPDYMYNVDVRKSGDDTWTPEAEYHWPGKASLHINAYSPFKNPEDLTSEGITVLPSVDSKGDLSLQWQTPADVAEQYDLLWASPVDASESPCNLSFNHALTVIQFLAGSELAPCTVKTIEVTNIVDAGSLNIENGEWTLTDSKSDFSVTPDITLTASDGSSLVAAGTQITSGENLLILPPQTLSSDSQINLTIEINDTEYSLSASLDGQTWSAGKTIQYRLSANPKSDSLILEVLDADGNPVNILQSHYTGDVMHFTVNSNYTSTEAGSSSSIQIPWKAEFIDDNGNVIDRPDWIISFPTEGEGDTSCESPTVLQDPDFVVISDETKILRSKQDINESSGMTPYNLSNSTGGPTVENTANCYIVSAPGKYSLPLVYGNAIKDGATNESAYTTSSHTRNILKNFINHLGNAISDPYIYNNSDCEPTDAYLVWEGRLCLISDVSLSDDKKFITFDVPATYIRQGNALLAVRDKDGNIMWSWQIWVTPYASEDGMMTFAYKGNNYHIMARNIGEISGGDDTYFTARTAKVRFTQTAVDDIVPKSIDITINRDDKHVITPFCYNFFQWGRKDPIISRYDVYKEWYDADHNEITAIRTMDFSPTTLGDFYITTSIMNPDKFYTGSHNVTLDYTNLWNILPSNLNGIKTIYDPSPLGFKVPGTMFQNFDKDIGKEDAYDFTYDDSNPLCPGISFELPDGTLFMALLGYLQPSTGNENNSVGKNGSVWTNLVKTSSNPTEARCFQFSSVPTSQFITDPLLTGFGIRPIKDE